MYSSLVTIFWVSLLAVIYSYLVYPVILLLISKLANNNNNNEKEINSYPSVAIVIAAYNEQTDIKDRIKNLLRLDYPKDKLEIIIGSDGSTDKTNQIASQFSEKLSFFAFKERRGKASVLNDLCSRVNSELIVFSDANTMFEECAIKQLVKHFSDSDLGGVCGELKLHAIDHDVASDSAYWRYEQFLKYHESIINGLLGANGAIYAIRSSLFQPIDISTIIDDFVIATNVIMQGFKFKYEPNAIAHEYSPDSMQHEFKRRVRIGIGNYQVFFKTMKLLNPFISTVHTFTYVSHKVIRWFTPHLLLICFFVNIFLLDELLFQLTFITQIAVYMFSLIVINLELEDKLPKVIGLVVYFVNMNVALFFGFLKYITSNINPAWERTSR